MLQSATTSIASLVCLLFVIFSVATGNDNDKPDDDHRVLAYTEQRTELFELRKRILDRDFEGALAHLQQHPHESKLLFVSSKQQGIKALPLHTVFQIDFEQNSSSQQQHDHRLMPPSQVKLIFSLLKANPLATGQVNDRQRLPIHLALLSPIPPPVKVIHAMLKIYKKAAKSKNHEGQTLLHMAVSFPLTSLENTNAILQANPSAVLVQDKQDESLPLHNAVWGGNFPHAKDIVQLLMEAYPKALDIRDGDNETPLTLIAKYGQTSTDVASLVLKKQQQQQAIIYRQDENDANGNTLLHYVVSAVCSSRRGTVNQNIYQPFLNLHPDLAKQINRLGQLPLHIALHKCCGCTSPSNDDTTTTTIMIHDLIRAFPQATSNRDGEGMLPLHHACRAGVADVSIIKTLVEMAPKTVKIPALSPSLQKQQRDNTRTMSPIGPLPLHLALASRQQQSSTDGTVMDSVLLFLLSHHQNHDAVQVRDPETNMLPLFTAIWTRRSADVLYRLIKATSTDRLLDHESIITTGSGQQEETSTTATTALHLFATVAPTYLQPNDISKLMQQFQEKAPSLFHKTNQDERLALHLVWASSQDADNNNNNKDRIFVSESRKVLANALVRANPRSVGMVDSSGRTPLVYAIRARDKVGFDYLLALYPQAVQMKTKHERYPLHELCEATSFENEKNTTHYMMKVLLQHFSNASRALDAKGELPLHKLIRSTAGVSFHNNGTTALELLLNAHPEAINQTDANGDLPLHSVIRNALMHDNDDAGDWQQQQEYWKRVVDIILHRNPNAAQQGKKHYPLSIAFEMAESLSMHRRSDNDILLYMAQQLYHVFPQAMEQTTKRKRTGLHSIMVFLGDMGGATPRGWTHLALRVMNDLPHLLEIRDHHGRTPLQLLTLYLSETAIGARNGQSIETRRLNSDLERVYHDLLLLYPAAMELKDEHDITPLEMATHKRLSLTRGSKRYNNSPILQMMHKHLRRGVDYWKWRFQFRTALSTMPPLNNTASLPDSTTTNCTQIKGILEKIHLGIKEQLNQFEVEPSGLLPPAEAFCNSTRKKKNRDWLCTSCEGEARMAATVEADLMVLTDTLDQISAQN